MLCEICKKREANLLNHYEEHIIPPRIVNICFACHNRIHRNHKEVFFALFERESISGLDIRKLMHIGGSICVTLPKEYILKKGLKPGDSVKVTYSGEDLFIEPVREEK